MSRKLSLASLPLVALIVVSMSQVTHQLTIPATAHAIKADAAIRKPTETELTSQSSIETYTVPLSAGYLNVLIPPDATVLSAELLGAQSGITWKYHGTFSLRCYQFAQIGVEISQGAQVPYPNARIQVIRNTKPFIAAGADPLSDRIIERLIKNPTYTGYGPAVRFGNIEHSKEWRGYPIMPVMKVQNYQLPLSKINYVIITSEQLQTLLTPLMTLKQRAQGVESFPMTTQTISYVYAGDSMQSKTLEFLKDAYNTWHMEYVLIAGGKSTLAPIEYQRMLSVPPQGTISLENRTTDYYYSTLEQPSNSYTQAKYPLPATQYPVDFPDFILGRFPSDDASVIKNMIDKTGSYETDTNPGQWVRTNLLVGGEDIGNPTWQWQQYTAKDRPKLALLYPYNLTSKALVNALNQGVGSVSMDAHADPYGWWLGGTDYFDYKTVDLLTNTKLPVIFSIGCHSGKWDVSQSVAVAMLGKPRGGAVAIVAGSSYTPCGDYVYFSAYNCWGRCPFDSWRLPDADYHVGKAFFYFTCLCSGCEYMNILGDPSLVLATSKYDMPIPEFTDMTLVAAFALILVLTIIRRRVGERNSRRYSSWIPDFF